MLPHQEGNSRSQRLSWCQSFIPALDGRPAWFPPFRDSRRIQFFHEENETWNFVRMEDAMMFDMVWDTGEVESVSED
jgi:hypothetical protein